MKKAFIIMCGVALIAACSRQAESLNIPTGSQVRVQKADGVAVEGRLVEVNGDRVIIETRSGEKTTVARREITAIKAADLPAVSVARADSATAEAAQPAVSGRSERPVGSTGTSSNALKKIFNRGPEYREVTLPAGTVLPVDLETSVGSDTSRVEQPVRGALRRGITVGGAQVLPAGTTVLGHVTAARRPGKVKGRGLIAMRFTEIETPEGRARMSTATVSRMAPATKKKDAMQIGIPAGAGAVIGGLIGGGKGAAEGALIGGGAGTAYVLSTRGPEVRLSRGANLAVRLTQPLTIRVRLK